jgi:hypothetical protein
MCLAYQKLFCGRFDNSEINYISTALTEITFTNTCIWAQTDAYECISGLCVQPRKWIHVLALTGIRVVNQDVCQKPKLKFWS